MSTAAQFLFSLGDANVTSVEKAILESPTSWLNDACIAFYFEHMKLSLLETKDANTGTHPILFMNPSAAWMAGMIEDSAELEMCLDQLSLSERELVLIPVNNAQDAEVIGGGSHWSLLAFHRASNAFFYLDSISSSSNNRPFANTYAKHLYPVLHCDKPGGSIVEAISSTQTNSFDCGMYLVCNTDAIYDFFTTSDIKKPIEVDKLNAFLKRVSPETARLKRKALLDLILDLSKPK